MKYNYFTLEDFLMDAYFVEWVNNGNPEVNDFWKAWLAEHPEKQELINRARQMVIDLSTHGKRLNEKDKAQLWSNLLVLRNTDSDQTDSAPKKAKQIFMGAWLRQGKLAASFAAILVTAFLLFWLKNRNTAFTHVSTKYGQVKQIKLPDGSEVILNGNSSISYPENWNNNARKVKLTGEAFFKVVHTQKHQKFRIDLSDRLEIEVLGTSFTATSRPAIKRVVLSEGKVKLALTTNQEGASRHATIETTLRPGDLVELTQKPVYFSKKQVSNPGIYAAFQQKQMVFEETPLSEVARVLKDTYGYQVTFAKPVVANKKFSGTIPANRIDLLLTAFEKLYRLKVVRQGKTIYIQ